MKKAFDWFDAAELAYDFHDYKKLGTDQQIIKDAIAQHGWEMVINKRGTTWRNLDDAVKNTMDAKGAVMTALDNPSIIKRPLIVDGDDIILGFNADDYAARFGGQL